MKLAAIFGCACLVGAIVFWAVLSNVQAAAAKSPKPSLPFNIEGSTNAIPTQEVKPPQQTATPVSKQEEPMFPPEFDCVASAYGEQTDPKVIDSLAASIVGMHNGMNDCEIFRKILISNSNQYSKLAMMRELLKNSNELKHLNIDSFLAGTGTCVLKDLISNPGSENVLNEASSMRNCVSFLEAGK